MSHEITAFVERDGSEVVIAELNYAAGNVDARAYYGSMNLYEYDCGCSGDFLSPPVDVQRATFENAVELVVGGYYGDGLVDKWRLVNFFTTVLSYMEAYELQSVNVRMW